MLKLADRAWRTGPPRGARAAARRTGPTRSLEHPRTFGFRWYLRVFLGGHGADLSGGGEREAGEQLESGLRAPKINQMYFCSIKLQGPPRPPSDRQPFQPITDAPHNSGRGGRAGGPIDFEGRGLYSTEWLVESSPRLRAAGTWQDGSSRLPLFLSAQP